MDRFNEHIEKYKPYLKNYDFSNTRPHKLLEQQRINPEKKVIKKRIKHLKHRITIDILNAEHIEKGTLKIGNKKYKGYLSPTLMDFVSLYIGYSELFKGISGDKIVNSVSSKKEFPIYCKIGVLFAKGLIEKVNVKEYGTFYCIYENKKFEEVRELSRYIEKETFKNKINSTTVFRYINDFLKKEFSDRQKKNIIEYCEATGVTPVENWDVLIS